MTIKQFKKLHVKLKKEVEKAMDNDCEINILGNGCNAFEVSNAIDQYDEWISELKDSFIVPHWHE